jgi:hypothetical protein
MKNKLLSKITPEQLIQDFQELGSAGKIGAKYGINTQTVYTAFKIINYDCRTRQDVASVVTKEILEEAYGRLGTLKAVGRELKIDPESVSRYMEKFDLNYQHQIIYNCDQEFFSRDNEETFYVAGFIAADGCVKDRKSSNGNRRYELGIGLSREDKDFLEQLRQIMKAETPVRDFLVKNSKRNPKWNDCWKSEIIITSKQMCDDLFRFDVIPRKSLIYTFPKWMKIHPLKHHFLRGYNDGDGSFFIPELPDGRKTEQVYFSMRGTPSFLTDARYILEQECDLEEREKDIRISSGQGVLEYGGNGVISKIADYLYRDATIYLPRKREIAMMAKQFSGDLNER